MSEFSWPVRVYYEDTDAGGVVFYANYLKFYERARTEYLRTLGFEQDRLAADDGVLFVVSRVVVEYKRPARFNDLLQVTARPLSVGRASLQFEQEILRGDAATANDGPRVLSTASVRIACVDALTLRPRPMPVSMQELLS
ncbi:MAG: tol-pal system-associated acyl-CoA thioesterase [Halothiobacillaceae bacterium]|jgi:acyl-CoA thioester hydrolase|nr:tol-pal system-associated acyl-CoA thioesterase [Halothiobacillaceae bacterium]MDY0049287.1 tol-pal system-associated acyl-CoA thioesterase [Halothiobacillaceae bacterium]